MVYTQKGKEVPKDFSYATSPSPSHGACLITEVFKVTSAQALNIEAHLTSIDLELDKETIQTAARLFFGSLYHTLTEGQSTQVK